MVDSTIFFGYGGSEIKLAVSNVTPTRIAIIDDQEIFLDSLRLALEMDPQYEVVATCNSGITALRELNHPLPDIVLMDFSMPDQSGLVTYSLLRERWPELAVIGMSGLLQVEPFALLCGSAPVAV